MKEIVNDKKSYFQLEVNLSNYQKIRARSVYNIVDMIAEVSGLADVILVTSRLIMSVLIYKRLLASNLTHAAGNAD